MFAFPEKNIVLYNFTDFNFLNKLQYQYKSNNIYTNLPFSGGWFVYLSYELIGQIEPILSKELCTSELPIAYAVRIPSAIIIDHKIHDSSTM